jgi:GT2 family glycosyltransferase
MSVVNITVVVVTLNRAEKLLLALRRIGECDPRPAEIIVHVDANDIGSAHAVRKAFPDVKVLVSENRVGPGGGRNRLIRAARNGIIASFDDDSYPIDQDYFRQLEELFARFPQAGVLAATVFHAEEDVQQSEDRVERVSDFVGCGCAYRRDAFASTSGYIPLALAYGMEEVDLALRLQEHGWGILRCSVLRVFHDTYREHHNRPEVTAATVANQILLTYLRYPLRYWWVGTGQLLNRIRWLLANGRKAGIISGLFAAPPLIRRFYRHRELVSGRTLRSYFKLRREPVPVQTAGDMQTRRF